MRDHFLAMKVVSAIFTCNNGLRYYIGLGESGFIRIPYANSYSDNIYVTFMEKIIKTFRTSVLFLCLLTWVGCATGSSIVTGTVRPAINSNDVKLYLDPPVEYETIGIVDASSEVKFSSQAATDRTIKELKKQAAKIGANGILITNTESKSGEVVGFSSGGVFYGDASETKTAKGRAIYVIRE